MQKVRNNKTIECFRFIASIMVLHIHCNLPSPYYDHILLICRTAVPFFILLSGYFSYNENPILKATIKLKSTIKIVIVTGIPCLIWNTINSYLGTKSFITWIIPYLRSKTIIHFFLFNRAVFLSSVYYYFFMIIYVYVIFILSCKLHLIKFMYYLIPILLSLLLIITKIRPWYWGGNWLFLGIPLFYLGHFIHVNDTIRLIIKGKEPSLIILGLILSYIEYRTFLTGGFIRIGTLITSVGILCFCLNNGDMKTPTILSQLGTRHTLWIMAFHCQVRDTLSLFISGNTYFFPFIVLIVTLSISCLINYCRERFCLICSYK